MGEDVSLFRKQLAPQPANGLAGRLVFEGDTGSLCPHRVSDRVATNGDVANKLGTYQLAVLAAHHGIPFYVAAPFSTVDLGTPHGEAMVIEERDPREVTDPLGVPIAPEGTPAFNPAFDVTPANLITALVTDRGVIRPPFGPALKRLARPSSGRVQDSDLPTEVPV